MRSPANILRSIFTKQSFFPGPAALFCLLIILIWQQPSFAQGRLKWSADGTSYYRIENGEIVNYQLPGHVKTLLFSKAELTPQGGKPLNPASFQLSADNSKLLLFTNTKKVWRLNTRGDYWVYAKSSNKLYQLGKGLPASSLMFAKFSPDGSKVAYVSDYNVYSEDLASGSVTKLTTDGNRKMINGTFDWAYEEEFYCRDGFRWSPDGSKIAFWQIDARDTKDYLMVNNTDSLYPFVVPVEYPISGERPSPFKIGVVNAGGGAVTWMKLPTDSRLGSYVPRMEWAGNNAELILQHLNRKQTESTLMICQVAGGESVPVYSEKDSVWIDVLQTWDSDYIWGGWDWLKGGQEFLWASDKDGWRHLYRVSRDGKKESLVTKGNYDVIDIVNLDEKGGFIYFMASPGNATRKYLYRSRLDGKGEAQQLSPANQRGTHGYDIGPGARYAVHTFSNYFTPPGRDFITLKNHKGLTAENNINSAVARADSTSSKTRFFKVTTAEGVEMDGWMVMPDNFDSTKKYPLVFFVYTEPAGANVIDRFGAGANRMYTGNMAKDGYIYMSIDNRGTPAPKGKTWRKSIYRKVGMLNISDQAMAAREVMKWNFVDTSRIAVWGWSGGGSATLNLMFQYPEIYKTGIAVAAVGNQRTYDNIYQERYMGLPEENTGDFEKGSPITYASRLRGNLLYVHGTGDDNVHWNNAEMLINELVKHNRQFQLMAYPNRTHGISEGAGTTLHLATMYTDYLKKNCPPGAR